MKYCEIDGCETEAVHKVKVTVNTVGDQTRHLCYPCFEAYTIGVQHGSRRTADGLAKELVKHTKALNKV